MYDLFSLTSFLDHFAAGVVLFREHKKFFMQVTFVLILTRVRQSKKMSVYKINFQPRRIKG